MNREPEAITDEFIAWLLQADKANASTAGEEADPSNSIMGDKEAMIAEEIQTLTPDSYSEQARSGQALEMGEIPAVQNHLQAALKRRIKTEIASRMPLFPWETEVGEYYDDIPDRTFDPEVPAQPWSRQLDRLNLPVPVSPPASILGQLLEQSQQVARSGLREGAKLVQAVEPLFPNHRQILNELAGRVLLNYRFNQWGLLELSYRGPVDQDNFPSSYQAATPTQQMELSLLAARQILSNLTLEPSEAEPVVEREWLTSAGKLTIKADYYRRDNISRLQIQAMLPCAGSLRFQGVQTEATAQRQSPGSLTVELSDLSSNQTYPLVVEFPDEAATPLIFAVCPTT